MNNPLAGLKLNATSTTVIIVGITALVLYFAIFYKGKSDEEKNADKISEMADANKNAVIAIEEEKGEKATWDDFVYKQYADQLYEAMDGIGTDTLAVSKVFEHILNKIDYIKLDQAYGTRDGYTMAADVVSELNSYWINQINGMLAKNGVGVKF